MALPTPPPTPSPTGGTATVPTTTPNNGAPATVTEGTPALDASGNAVTGANGVVSLNEFNPLTGAKLTPGQQVPAAIPATGTVSSSGTPPPISADGISTSQTAPIVAQTTPDTTSTGLQSTVNSINDQFKSTVAADTARESAYGTQQSGLSNDISALLTQEGQLTGPGKEALYAANGVDQKAAAVKTISSQIDAANKATNDQIAAIQSSGGFGASTQAQIAYLQRTNAQYTANLAINLTAANGQYTTAQSIAERQLADQLAPIDAAIKSKQFLYQNNQNLFDKADAQRLKDQSDYLSLFKDQSSAAITNITAQMTNGTIDPAKGAQAISDVLAGKSLSDIYKGLSNGGSTAAVSGGPGTLNGTDLTSHATDPQYATKVTAIFNNLPTITDAVSAQAAINASGYKAPFTGQQVMDAAKAANVDPKTMLAMMQEESSLGTSNVAVKNNNFDGITWTQSYQDAHPGTTVGSARPASEGGNYVKFPTVADGLAANASWIAAHPAASTAPTVQQYGLLANTDFNPNNTLDKTAYNYLQQYIKNGAIPKPSEIGISTKGAAGQNQFGNAAIRAGNLYTAATGQPLPNPAIIKSNTALITANNKVLNSNAIQSDAIQKNFNLAINGEISGDVNKNATVINNLLNPIRIAFGDPATVQALVSNGTISQEFANLLAIKNNGGTTVSDKETAANLIPFGTSVDAQKAVVQRLETEAMNIKSSLQSQNASLYQQIDPLAQDANNPARQQLLANTPEALAFGKQLAAVGITASKTDSKSLNIPSTQWQKLVSTHDPASGLSQGDTLLSQLKAAGYNLVVS